MKYVLVTLVTLSIASLVCHARDPEPVVMPEPPTTVDRPQEFNPVKPIPLESTPIGTETKNDKAHTPWKHKLSPEEPKAQPKSKIQPTPNPSHLVPNGIEGLTIESQPVHLPEPDCPGIRSKPSDVVQGCLAATPKVSCMPKIYGEAEYLLWWIRDQDLPPLVTGANLSAAQLAALGADPNFVPGAIGQAGTQLLLGGSQDFESSLFHGVRGLVGYGIPQWGLGVEVGGFYMPEQRQAFSVNSSGQPALFRPFIDPITNANMAMPIADPGIASGSIDAIQSTELYGGEANIRKNVLCSRNHSLDVIGGFRYLNLEESLRIQSVSSILGTGDSLLINDSWGTRNQFYGGQGGLRYTLRKGRWVLMFDGKVGFGTMNQTVLINGMTTMTTGDGSVSAPGGLLTSGTNLGRVSDDEFVVIPEGTVRLGYQITPRIGGYVGYNFLYLSSVVRPGDQINPVPGAMGVPDNFAVRDSDFWAQGLTFGLQFRY